ncbi:MAG: coenzyme F420-0:L-glutamate ligase [Anaerolineae bacterium]|nr:coenzyme F420-0:L-glutamate ligase [Anaerolineae bacterium]
MESHTEKRILLVNTPQIQMFSLPGLPIVKPGDDVARLIADGLERGGLVLQPSDILVVTSKIVSKSEGRFVDLRTVTPSERARQVAAITGKEPELVEVILSESASISRMRQGTLVTRHRLGFVSANAGIDRSNVGPDGEMWVLLLPVDPDASARRLREALHTLTGVAPAIVISDTHGRPFRLGNVGVAIGAAGLPALLDLRGRDDLFHRKLMHTDIALADELAAAADLLSGQAAEGRPVTLIRGVCLPPGAPDDGRAADLNRPLDLDLFR